MYFYATACSRLILVKFVLILHLVHYIYIHYIYICKGSGTDSFQVQNIKVSGLFQEKIIFLDLLKQKTSLSYVNILYVSEVKTSS